MSTLTRLRVLLVGVAAASCLSPPGETLTTQNSLFDLTSGPKLLTISGGDVTGDSAHLRPCAPLGPPAGGKLVSTRIDLEAQGSDWIGRSIAASDGNVVLTLHSVGPAFGAHTVTGTISGSAISVIPTPVAPPSRVRIVFDSLSPESIDGGGEQIGQFVNGNITGQAAFTDTAGAVSSCTWLQWTLQPLPE
jgi:hypothetical protein